MSRTRLLITRRLADEVLALANQKFDVSLWPADEPIGAALLERAAGCDALLVMPTERMDRPTLQAMRPGVRALATHSVGYDHIDLDAATELGLPVFHTPDVLNDAVAETAMLLILSACRGASSAEAVLRRGEWGPWSPTQFVGRQLTGRRLGIYGMGRIGVAVAQRARGFGVELHYHNRSPAVDAAGMHYHATLESLMRVSDILCVCAPSTPQTRGAINRERIELLPPGAVFVNIARGDLVDEPALMDAIASGRIGAAGLDVYRNEPRIDPRWLTLPRTTLLPHIGSGTQEARVAMGRIALEALDAWLHHGRVPPNCLNPGVAKASLHP
ncbi:MAG: D-glycerate dehydrogenase [Pseudomonadota bacterium]